jgi:alkylation response protein AidB-like acyl-CoA dehydrogenase
MNGPANTIDKADEAQLLATIDRWVEREVAPRVKEFDHADRWPAELVEQMKELGLFGATVSPDYGGLGLPARTYAEIVMRVSSVWMALTGIFNSHLMLALAIEKFGTEPQKRHWLPRLASGEVRGGLALTEPDAGTDLQAIRLVARRDGDHYVLNGTKTWISNGIEGSCFALLVKTNPQAQPRYSGMSLFIAPQGAGLPGRPQAREAGLQVDRFGRADLRGLPRAGRSSDRRGRRPRLHPGGGWAGTGPHQCRGARRWHR